MKNSMNLSCHITALRYYLLIVAAIFSTILPEQVSGQCTPSSGTIRGNIFIDKNNNGIFDASESGIEGILVEAYNAGGQLISSQQSGSGGAYVFTGLTDGNKVRLHFGTSGQYSSAGIGPDNGSAVQFVQVPACNVRFGVISTTLACDEKTDIITTCFVQGTTAANIAEPTIVAIQYGFNSDTPARKFATHGETGSIWGLAWKSRTKEIFSAAFIKQYSGLKAGHDAIFRTTYNGTMYVTEKFVNLSALGQSVGTMTSTVVTDCDYGKQVGRLGLGSMVISPDEQHLYVVNIHNNTLVKIPTKNPTSANTVSYQIPGTGIHAFALKYYNNKIYVGTTTPGTKGSVLIFDPINGTFVDSGLIIPVGADWTDNPSVNSLSVSRWLTDIDFAVIFIVI
jgi:SdrD B-like domain